MTLSAVTLRGHAVYLAVQMYLPDFSCTSPSTSAPTGTHAHSLAFAYSLTFPGNSCFEDKLTDAFFKAVVHHALHSAFGLVGGGIHVDLLVFDSDSQSAVLRVDKECVFLISIPSNLHPTTHHLLTPLTLAATP